MSHMLNDYETKIAEALRRFVAGFVPGFFKTTPSLLAFNTTACSVRPSLLLMNEIGNFSEIM